MDSYSMDILDRQVVSPKCYINVSPFSRIDVELVFHLPHYRDDPEFCPAPWIGCIF
jgi:hypothetical protein